MIDVSQMRDVPDSQEVFLIEQPNELDQSIIFDLLEYVEGDNLAEALAVHLEDILDNPAIFLAPLESGVNSKIDCEMHFFLVKPALTEREKSEIKLFMYIALLRVKKTKTDIVVTMNVPCDYGALDQETFLAEAQNILQPHVSVLGQAYTVIKTAASSMSINDWDLFA